MEEELKIIARVNSGDTEAFELLVAANQSKVYSLALRMTGNEEDALDISQEAFLRAYLSLSGFRGDSKFSVWMYRLTSNLCIDFLRKKKRGTAVTLTLGEDEDSREQELEIPDQRYCPETEVERRALREAVNSGLAELTEEYRQILILREISGLSYEEIAKTLDLEPGTVKSRIFRARKKLAAILLREGNFPDGVSV